MEDEPVALDRQRRHPSQRSRIDSRTLRARPPRPRGAVGTPIYDGRMALSLIAGPANAGKVELLLDRYLAALEREPVLIVPTRSDVERVERDLLDPAAGAARRLDRHLRRRLRADRVRRRRRAAARLAGAARAARASRARRRAPERPLRLGPVRRLRRRAAPDRRRARVRPPRSGESRRRPRRVARRLPRRARPARALGPRPASPPRGRAAPVRARRLARRAGLRLRVRGPDGRRVGAAGGARGANRGLCLAPVRAGPARVRVAPSHRRGSLASRGRQDRGAAAAFRGDRASGDRPSRAGAVQRRSAAAGAGRRRDSLLRGRGRARRARARRRGAARAAARGDAAGADRDRLPEPRALAGAARHGARHARRPVLGRRRRAARADAARRTR